MYTEHQLIERLQKNDKVSFSYLYDKYSGAVYGMLYKITGDRKAADLILQQTFVKIWHDIKKYDIAKSRLFTWMVNIAKHYAINSIRNNNDKIKKNTASKSFTKRKKINNCTTNQNQIIELIYFYGYTTEETAEQFSISLQVLKAELRMGIMELRKSMAN